MRASKNKYRELSNEKKDKKEDIEGIDIKEKKRKNKGIPKKLL